MPVSIFLRTSVEGSIARADGDGNFLPEGGGESDERSAGIEVTVIGRKHLNLNCAGLFRVALRQPTRRRAGRAARWSGFCETARSKRVES